MELVQYRTVHDLSQNRVIPRSLGSGFVLAYLIIQSNIQIDTSYTALNYLSLLLFLSRLPK